MIQLLKEIPIGVWTVIAGGVGAFLTYLGTKANTKASVDEIYTKEIRGIIDELKQSNSRMKQEMETFKTELERVRTEITAKDDLISVLKADISRLTQEKADYKRWCLEKDSQIKKMKVGK